MPPRRKLPIARSISCHNCCVTPMSYSGSWSALACCCGRLLDILGQYLPTSTVSTSSGLDRCHAAGNPLHIHVDLVLVAGARLKMKQSCFLPPPRPGQWITIRRSRSVPFGKSVFGGEGGLHLRRANAGTTEPPSPFQFWSTMIFTTSLGHPHSSWSPVSRQRDVSRRPS